MKNKKIKSIQHIPKEKLFQIRKKLSLDPLPETYTDRPTFVLLNKHGLGLEGGLVDPETYFYRGLEITLSDIEMELSKRKRTPKKRSRLQRQYLAHHANHSPRHRPPPQRKKK